MLYAILENESIETESPPTNDNSFTQYLETLSRDELISLILKYAPENFRNKIRNKSSGAVDALSVFKKIEKATRKLLTEVDYEDAPDDISSALGALSDKLIGLEKHLKNELPDYIFSVIKLIDDAQSEGYLYDDYNDDVFECPSEFEKLVNSFLKTLRGKEKTQFLKKLDEMLAELSHTGFESLSDYTKDIFDPAELPDLKTYFLDNLDEFTENLAEKYYQQLNQLMSVDEKEKVLIFLQEDYTHRLKELSDLYIAKGERRRSIELVKDWLESGHYHFPEEVYLFYLDLIKDEDRDSNLGLVCAEAITKCPSKKILYKIDEVFKGDIGQFEKILESRSSPEYLDFLESRGRLQEALALINRSKTIYHERILKFFKLHKMLFKSEAIVFFSNIVKDNLHGTGDSYYQAIVDALQQLKKLDNSVVNGFVSEIRTNYRRRRNLIAMLNKL